MATSFGRAAAGLKHKAVSVGDCKEDIGQPTCRAASVSVAMVDLSSIVWAKHESAVGTQHEAYVKVYKQRSDCRR